MIHTKSLIRRLAYVPWLLAFGLVLGWAGEAQAQTVTLLLDKPSVREDAGETTIMVTAKLSAKRPNDPTTVTLSPGIPTGGTSVPGLNSRFHINSLPSIVIPKNTESAKVPLVITPVNDKLRGDDYVNNGIDSDPTDGIIDDDLNIIIAGNAGSITVTSANLLLIDDDKLSTEATFSFDPGDLSKDAGGSPVKVTATLNGSLGAKDLTIPLTYNSAPPIEAGTGNVADSDPAISADMILGRDTEYTVGPASLKIRRKRPFGSVELEIDPKGKAGYIALEGRTNNRNTAETAELGAGQDTLWATGVDLNSDGDTGDTFTLSTVSGSEGQLTRAVLGSTLPANFPTADGATTDPITEALLGGIDLNNDGDTDDASFTYDTHSNDVAVPDLPGEFTANTAPYGTGPGVIKESDIRFPIVIKRGFFKIKADPLSATKDDGLAASPASIRENEGSKEIELTVTLKAEATKEEAVTFEIIPISGAGLRDEDYIVSVDDAVVKEGAAMVKTTLYLTPIDNIRADGEKSFQVRATVGGNPAMTTIKIIDDESLTTNIALRASPAEAKVGVAPTEITVTAEINGMPFEEAVNVVLVLEPKNDDTTTAQRDTDFTAVLRSLTIPAEAVTGEIIIDVTAINGGDKKFVVKALKSPVKNSDDEEVMVGSATITLKDADATAEEEEEDPGAISFGDDVDLGATAFLGTVGEEFEKELPAATGGEGDLTYSVSTDLPAGLKFDPATRTISGTPTMSGPASVVYSVFDGEGNSAVAQFTIEIAKELPPTTMVASVSVSQSSVRESGESASISIKATFTGPAPKDETIRFTLGAPSEGKHATRDVDFTASLHGKVSIAAGAPEATTTMTLTPIDNMNVDGNRVVGVHAMASGGSASADITIADDETASKSISLSADPHTVSEADGNTELTITATLDGKVLDDDAEVTLSIDSGSEAARDVDYRALFLPVLTITAGEVSGSTSLFIDPISDEEDEGNETITLHGAISGLEDGTGLITISDYEMMDPEMAPLAFAEGAMIDVIEATAGTAIADVVLPEATVGSGDITYSVSELPAGLTFADSTRTLSGTPEAATEGAVEVTYTATVGEESVSLTFSITVNSMLDFGELGALFGLFDAAGKANPAQDDGEGALQLTVGVPVDLTLPEIPGGTGEKTYSMSGLPAGLSFDGTTRTISGTPTEEGLAVVILTVTDSVGATGQVPVPVSVVLPPLDAPDNLVAEDYKGADGLGDQGGFVMLSWDLSEQHDSIDGYRIFRALPVLGNEMVPWAMVDAVPGVETGRAIVATLDNVSTRWGIAAESGGRTTHGAAKAVFVDAENPYELMAETMMASREAAQAGNGPVFASLLPEALAYAQGVAPKLNLIGSVISSAVTMTEEAVGATDDIAPLAVPSLSVLDAPNDEGGRIALTWTLSPSDQLLQGVIVGAIGPAAVESIVGVHGYSIYRSATGEDEFSLIAQVDAGVASFVDETALNGVHYTYQVRPYDLDNETGSDIEQTAMAVRNSVLDSEGRAIYGLFGADNRIGFDDFFIFADNFGLTAEDAGFDPAFDLAPSEAIDFDDFFVFADNFGRSIAAAGKRVPMLAGLNADARMYLDARTAMPNVGEDFVLDVRLADFVAVKGYGLQVQYEADKLAFVEVLTDQPLGGSELATPQVLADQAGVLTVAAHGDIVSDGEVALSLVFRPTTEIENTVIEIADNQTYDSEFGFNRLALPAPVQVQTRPEVFSLANNYPNPFNPATTIKYALPLAADVELTVYNVLGQPVRTLIAEHQNAGRYVVEWDATNDSGHSLSSGMYFYRLEAGGDLEVKKMLLLK